MSASLTAVDFNLWKETSLDAVVRAMWKPLNDISDILVNLSDPRKIQIVDYEELELVDTAIGRYFTFIMQLAHEYHEETGIDVLTTLTSMKKYAEIVYNELIKLTKGRPEAHEPLNARFAVTQYLSELNQMNDALVPKLYPQAKTSLEELSKTLIAVILPYIQYSKSVWGSAYNIENRFSNPAVYKKVAPGHRTVIVPIRPMVPIGFAGANP